MLPIIQELPTCVLNVDACFLLSLPLFNVFFRDPGKRNIHIFTWKGFPVYGNGVILRTAYSETSPRLNRWHIYAAQTSLLGRSLSGAGDLHYFHFQNGKKDAGGNTMGKFMASSPERALEETNLKKRGVGVSFCWDRTCQTLLKQHWGI